MNIPLSHLTWNRPETKTLLVPFMIGVLAVAGCTNVPELDATIPSHLRNADYPRLVRLDGSFATAQTPRDQAEEIEQELETRRRRLQQRARNLNNPPN